MSMKKQVKRILLQTPIGRVLMIPKRVSTALGYYTPQLTHILHWGLTSREFTNFTYDLTDENIEYLAHTIAIATNSSYSRAIGFIRELQEDKKLKQHVIERIRNSPFRHVSDQHCWLGRRVGWYAFVRLLRPRVVVETGVDKGHGAVVLCAALLRNAAEGFPGRYYGTDINPQAGFLLSAPYSSVGEVLYGDSIESLRALNGIDLFINDSDHSAEYEQQEYETIFPRLSSKGVILGDNCHCNDVLAEFSRAVNRQFIFFREVPKNHWYPGGGIGISFTRRHSGVDVPSGTEHHSLALSASGEREK